MEAYRSDHCDHPSATSFHRTRPWPQRPTCLCEFTSSVLHVFRGSHRGFLQIIAEDSERSQQRPTCSAAPNHSSRQDRSLGARRRQEHRRARLSSVSPNSSSSNSPGRAGPSSAVPRLSSLRLGDLLEVPSNPHNQLVGYLEAPRPSSSRLKGDLYSGVPQLNQPRVADSLAHNNPSNNNREDRFLAARNNRLSNREAHSLGAPSNLPPARRPHCLGQHNSSLPPRPHCLVVPNSHKQDPRCLEAPNLHYLVPLPPRPSHSSSHPVWELRSVRSL